MTPEEFRLRYAADGPALGAWGKEICEILKDAFSRSVKVPIGFRLKDEKSLIEKAFYRRKPYTDPYGQITDKVGARVVVLLETEVSKISAFVQDHILWDASFDRDFEEERRREPLVFNYQSNHFILRSKSDHIFDDTAISENTPCELQIRTLLQHAYSELSHDLIYKTKLQVEPEVKRLAARSMALIETTDGVFLSVRSKIEEKEGPSLALMERAEILLNNNGISEWPNVANDIIIDAIRSLINGFSVVDMDRFLSTRSFIYENIRDLSSSNPIYSTPAVLVLVSMIPNAPAGIAESWPYTRADLEPLYSLVGRSLPD